MHTVPACVGIIMDGNRRWASGKGLPKLAGHNEGRKTFRDVVRWAREASIPHLIVYVFSTENWNRASEEVSYLMDLLEKAIQEEIKELVKEGVRIRFIGQRDRFSPKLQKAMGAAEEETKNNTALNLWICLSYGGQAEIVAAAVAAAATGSITEESLQKHLWTAEMPDPDIIIRTGGEKRLSNFLTWQSVYSELFFIDTLWPDFSKKEFDSILADFSTRDRRHGK